MTFGPIDEGLPSRSAFSSNGIVDRDLEALVLATVAPSPPPADAATRAADSLRRQSIAIGRTADSRALGAADPAHDPAGVAVPGDATPDALRATAWRLYQDARTLEQETRPAGLRPEAASRSVSTTSRSNDHRDTRFEADVAAELRAAGFDDGFLADNRDTLTKALLQSRDELRRRGISDPDARVQVLSRLRDVRAAVAAARRSDASTENARAMHRENDPSVPEPLRIVHDFLAQHPELASHLVNGSGGGVGDRADGDDIDSTEIEDDRRRSWRENIHRVQEGRPGSFTGVWPILKGKMGVMKWTQSLKRAGGEVVQTEIPITIRRRGQTGEISARIDQFVKMPDGRTWAFVEVKNGPNASLSRGQTEAIAAVREGLLVTPVGKEAHRSLLAAGHKNPGGVLPPNIIFIYVHYNIK
ncbi:MAG: hypothetical protein IPK81_07340 [Rhodospirillales bacterium]|nr:MAG: hypothetical protein IPK81_07340 [Rhodospirillales bacterium]